MPHASPPSHSCIHSFLSLSTHPTFQVSEYSNSDGTSGFNYSRLEEEHGKSIIAGPNAANGGGRSPDRYNTSFAENSSSSSSGRNNINNEGGSIYFPTDASNYNTETSTNKTEREEEREARTSIETARPPSWDQFDRNRIYLSDQESCSSFPNSGQNSTLGTGSAHHDPCAMVTVSDLTGNNPTFFLFSIFLTGPLSHLCCKTT